jgi:hypothetical protein
MSTTLNVKGNRQIVVASYTTEAVFKIPDGLDLEDKTVVQDWRTKYGKLYITYVNSEELLEIDSEWDTEIDYKYSQDEVIENADEYDIEYEEDNCEILKKYEVRMMRTIYTSGDKGLEILLSKTFSDFEKARFCYHEYVEGCILQTFCAKDEIHVEFDDITDECDPEMIARWSMKEEEDEIECVRICKNCEPKSESDDGEVKEYRITDINFDTKCESDSESDNEEVKDRDEFLKEFIEETCSKTWFACDEEQLCDKISNATGWLINSYSCELVC